MNHKKNILAIIGSASKNSANLKLVEKIAELSSDELHLDIFDNLAQLPHFSAEASIENTPEIIIQFRQLVAGADGILICTPEYIFSIPSGLKNALEWCVSTTVFSGKRVGLITASAHGVKGQEELKLIMKTLEAVLSEETTLLIQGIKGKIDRDGNIADEKTRGEVADFLTAYKKLIAG